MRAAVTAKNPTHSSFTSTHAGILAFSTTIFLSAYLLFSLEPLVARTILPWIGGSAAVCSTCLVFYQVALLVGYLYVRILTRALSRRSQGLIHIAVLVASLALLPIGPRAWWKPSAPEHPAWLILAMLTATIGLPFAALSATSPLLQDWLAGSGHKSPYQLFALSNLASFAALFSYPLLIEPLFGLHAQVWGWSVLYLGFAAMCGAVSWQSRSIAGPLNRRVAEAPVTSPTRRAYWLALSASGAMLLLSVTNHITKNVAPFPLLWVLPLGIYLLTFVMAFRAQHPYQPALWRPLVFVALLASGFAVSNITFSERLLLPVFLLGLFVACYFCHGELVRMRPRAEDLTGFYLLLSAGGAAGAIFVGLIAPLLFAGIYELPLSLLLVALLALSVSWKGSAWPARLLWMGLACVMVLIFQANVAAYHKDALVLTRSFYGSLRVIQPPSPRDRQHRAFFYGNVEHGVQFQSPKLRDQPTTYYGPDSGVGIVLSECLQRPMRVGVVGLGVGTVATYGRAGDVYRFYELNPQVIEIARSQFTFLKDSQASVSTIEGDARLSLEREKEPPYDVLVLDAFSGDAVPVHLLTREALALYLRHLKPDGMVAFHLTNRFLDLPPVVRQLADEAGYSAVLVRNSAEESQLVLPSSWVLVTRNASVLENATIRAESLPIPARTGARPWTDEYNNLFQVFEFFH